MYKNKIFPRIAFLLGAGISIPAKFDSVNTLTDRVMRGVNAYRHSDSCYYINETTKSHQLDEHVEYILIFLRKLKRIFDSNQDYFSDNRRKINYEDLAYFCAQLNDNDLGEYENPALFPLVKIIYQFINKLNEKRRKDGLLVYEPQDLFNEASNYIRDIVWRSLVDNNQSLDYLSPLSNFCFDKDFNTIQVFTLNHDTLFEKHLSTRNICFTLGFGEAVNGVRYWNPTNLETSYVNTKVVKLHGSINWFKYPPNKLSNQISSIGIPSNWDYQHTIGPDGTVQHPNGSHPLFLLGTFNKILHYSKDIYADLFCYFRCTLRSIDTIIVSGYGFGDKGINSQIIEWMAESGSKRIIIIHKNPNYLFSSARNAIRKNRYNWENQGRLKIITKFIHETSYDEIRNEIIKI